MADFRTGRVRNLLAARMGIRAIPTIALFRKGTEVKRVSGALDARTLAGWVEG